MLGTNGGLVSDLGAEWSCLERVEIMVDERAVMQAHAWVNERGKGGGRAH
jgi:hypothetical protein